MTQYQEAAIRAGDWLVRTQQKQYDDANLGRFFYAVDLETGYTELSTGWQTGFAVISLLSLHKFTGDEKYLEAARLGIEYIKTLQIMDSRQKRFYGAIREETPQTNWLHPRDAVSAGWALLIYGNYANDHDSRERAALFGDWLVTKGMRGDWPLCTVNIGPGGHASDDLRGSFQSGGILFLIDLYESTQNMLYYDAALRMSDYYVDNFIDENGIIKVLVDPIGNNPGANDTEKWPLAWRRMHQINDDFGGIALVGSYKLFCKESYLQRMSAYFSWIRTAGNADGSFLDPVMEVGSATVPIFLNAYAPLAQENEQDAIAELNTRSLDYLLSIQQNTENENSDGAFLGLNNKCQYGLGKWVNIRCSAYAILALLQQSNDSLFPYEQGGHI